MKHIKKKRSKKSGLPPGSLVHIGEKKIENVSIKVINYSESNYHEEDLKDIEKCLAFKNNSTVTWVDIDGLHQVEIIQKLGDCYGFHPLVLEDILNTDQRPKIEDYGSYLYIVLKMLTTKKSEMLTVEQVSLIMGKDFIISFQEGVKGDVFNPIRERIKTGKGRIRSMGADYLAYSLIDAIVDNYFILIEKFGEQIEDLEDELIENPNYKTLTDIHQLKMEMIFLRKAVWPLREVINVMARRESPLIKDNTIVYLRDIYDHIIQVMDSIDTSRDMLSGMLDIYLTSISNRTNEIMKFLTLIGTIFIPLTFIAGVYGMNFQYMPELSYKYGYFVLLGFMFFISIMMLFYFKKKKWL